ncbi:hypothetical protein BLL42_23785 [Pseudomonas frederiksbergensis]|uniref:Uncharacterized protein n=1 Tax=Pseudomonas frederiksbergensis TaxID=104087 RepID=A0A1J0ER07_9PSED|nr:hypothetical protein [Pseudomonas frederiksbergensis]APC18586.1 hypothetical protein BLL42_23785 [Pseudomonas frederiksbergensis]
MRLRKLFVVLMSDSLSVVVSAFYAVFLVSLIERLISLEGVYYKFVLGVVFLILVVVHFFYYTPSIIAVTLGRPVEFEKQSVAALYFGVFISSLLCAAIVIQMIGDVVSLTGLCSIIVNGLVFFIIFIGLSMYVKKLNRKH